MFIEWAPVLVWAGVIFLMSTRFFGSSFSARLVGDMLGLAHLQVSAQTFGLLNHLIRKTGHFTEYSILAIFLYRAWGNGDWVEWRPRRALVCVLVAGLYSLTDEFHQRFVPGRGPSIVDCGFDTIGAMLGMVIVYLWHLWSRGPKQV